MTKRRAQAPSYLSLFRSPPALPYVFGKGDPDSAAVNGDVAARIASLERHIDNLTDAVTGMEFPSRRRWQAAEHLHLGLAKRRGANHVIGAGYDIKAGQLDSGPQAPTEAAK